MTSSLATGFLLVLLLSSTDAYKTFETVCSKPSEVVNYVSSADTRSTLDILWSCLLTIIACTWSVQHLNVPEQREGRDRGFFGDVKWALKRTWTSIKWMVATVLAPELLLWKSFADRDLVKFYEPELDSLAKIDGVPWTLSHTHFSNMGGFVMRSFASDQQDNTSVAKSRYKNPFHLTTLELLKLREKGILEKLPHITEDELLDKSKGDNFVRGISILQISWMAVQIIARGFKHLAISQLEIGVLAFAVCAVFIYIMCWEKPKSVQIPITILVFEGEIPSGVMTVIGETALATNAYAPVTLVETGKKPLRGSRIQNHIVHYAEKDKTKLFRTSDFFAILFGTMVFGRIHIAAWNFEFPTLSEQILWRVFSVYCSSALGVLMFFVVGSGLVLGLLDLDGFDDQVGNLVASGVIGIYVLGRLFLLVELFRTLCFLPPPAYIATWAANIPHLS